MKNDELFPGNFVVYPAFITLLSTLIQRISEDYDDFSQLYPWVALTKNNPEKNEYTDYNLYIALLESLIQYATVSIPNRNKKIEELREKQNMIFKKYGKSNVPSYKKIEDELGILWSQIPNASWYSKHYSFQFNIPNNEHEFLKKTLTWIFIKCKLISPNTYADNLIGFLSIEDLKAWQPLFRGHITNETLCSWTKYGQRIISSENSSIVSEEYYWENAEDFRCFYSSTTLSLWIDRLNSFEYDKTVAREFFGHKGFLSHLYCELFLNLDPKGDIFTTYIDNVVLPQFDASWIEQ